MERDYCKLNFANQRKRFSKEDVYLYLSSVFHMYINSLSLPRVLYDAIEIDMLNLIF